MRKLTLLVCALWMVTSCSSISGTGAGPKIDQLRAENRMMKKNLKLALRENEVLKTENIRYRTDVYKLEATVADLRLDLESLHCKYSEDMTRMNDDYENLAAHLAWIEKQSEVQIAELTAANSALEKKYAEDVSRLNTQLKEQLASFNAERESLKTRYESNVTALENQLELSRQAAVEKDAAINAMALDLAQTQARAAELETTVTEQAQIIKKGETDFQQLLKSSQDLQKTIEEKQAMIDALNPKPGSAPGPLPQNRYQ